MGAAVVIHPDGEMVDVNLNPGSDRLAIMYEQLDCRAVDVVALTDRLDMWIDDDGFYTQEVNPIATRLARRYGFTWQAYHGPVMLCGVDEEGESHDLTRDQLVALLTGLTDLVDD